MDCQRDLFGDRLGTFVGDISPQIGNYSALSASECRPERLWIASYLNEYALVHDGDISSFEDVPCCVRADRPSLQQQLSARSWYRITSLSQFAVSQELIVTTNLFRTLQKAKTVLPPQTVMARNLNAYPTSRLNGCLAISDRPSLCTGVRCLLQTPPTNVEKTTSKSR